MKITRHYAAKINKSSPIVVEQSIVKEEKKVEVKKPKQVKQVIQEVPITAEDQAFLDELFAKKEI